MNSGIYAIVNKKNGRRYYGSTNDLHRRKSEHWKALRKNCHHSRFLQRAWNKHGEDAFSFIVIEYVLPVFLLDVEQMYLDKNKKGYNCAKCAERPPLGLKRTKATRRKLSVAHKGRKLTKEHKTALSQSLKGRKVNEITRDKIRASLMGHAVSEKTKTAVGDSNRKRVVSDETKNKMSQSQKQQWRKRKLTLFGV